MVEKTAAESFCRGPSEKEFHDFRQSSERTGMAPFHHCHEARLSFDTMQGKGRSIFDKRLKPILEAAHCAFDVVCKSISVLTTLAPPHLQPDCP